MARAAALGRGVSDALEVAVRDEYAAWKLYNAVVALKEFIVALDHTKFDVFIGTPDALKRLQDARYMAEAVVLMAEVPNAPPLLAAAPEMLIACRAIVTFHAEVFRLGYPIYSNGVAIDHTELNKACMLADAAIAKAEGR